MEHGAAAVVHVQLSVNCVLRWRKETGRADIPQIILHSDMWIFWNIQCTLVSVSWRQQLFIFLLFLNILDIPTHGASSFHNCFIQITRFCTLCEAWHLPPVSIILHCKPLCLRHLHSGVPIVKIAVYAL
jgi:hypothetical protein